MIYPWWPATPYAYSVPQKSIFSFNRIPTPLLLSYTHPSESHFLSTIMCEISICKMWFPLNIYIHYKNVIIRRLSILWKEKLALNFNMRCKRKKNMKCLDTVAIANVHNPGLYQYFVVVYLYVCLFCFSNLWSSKITKLNNYTKVSLWKKFLHIIKC